MASEGDTIFALATPPGRSAIAIVRISGPQAAMVPTVFGVPCPKSGHFAVAWLRQSNREMLDQVVLLFMAGPRSSTGEDVLEIQCHGGIAVVQSILAELVKIPGLRSAEPGEFTHRMFHNGKTDLLGVESLADVIDADTRRQLGQAWEQAQGGLRARVMQWRAALIQAASQLEVVIDFPDEEIPADVASAITLGLIALCAEIADSLDDNQIGERVRDGVSVALLGPVNAGKSTLINRLAQRPVAIVSAEAGTTRDLVSVSLDIGGVPVTITDTAGIRDDVGVIEEEGITRALAAVHAADQTVIVLDGSSENWRAEYHRLRSHAEGRHMLVLNKADKGGIGTAPDDAMVMSLQDDVGVDLFIDRLKTSITNANVAGKGAIITRVRHRQALEATLRGVEAGLRCDLQQSPEIVAEEIRTAVFALGRITGEIDVEELLDAIFSSFCIGK